MKKRRVCYVVHWSCQDIPESRIYPNLTNNVVKFMDDLHKENLSSGPVLERIVIGDLTHEDKKKLRRIQNGERIFEDGVSSPVFERGGR